MSRCKKLLLFISIFMITILVSTVVHAEILVFDKEEGVVDHHFFPHRVDGSNMFYCIQYGGSYNATLTRQQYNAYKVGDHYPAESVCAQNPPEKPWQGKLKYMKYEPAGQITTWQHQDEAYILADAIEKGNLASWDVAYATWSSSISNPRQAFSQGAEGAAYKTFYEMTHNNSTDIFDTLVVDKTNKSAVNIGVNQENGTYTVGPFQIEYPNGQYNGINKFSWIKNIQAVTDAGTYNTEILSAGGATITGLGKDENNTLNGKKFYIRFQSREATWVRVKIDFGYLESCSATMQEYKGKYMLREWVTTTAVADGCDHTVAGTCSPSCPDYGRLGHGDADHPNTGYKDDKVWNVLTEKNGTATQRLMALVGTATKNYKETTIYIPGGGKPDKPDNPDGPIDLTMKIAGAVFLDKDTGKVNAGNNRFDKNLGEALSGVEVTLCDENGNDVSVLYDVKHTHTGSSQDGTGCYTIPVYHVHDGSPTSYGRCYTQATHTHIGSAAQGGPGTCFQQPVYHEHYDTCYTDIQYHTHTTDCYKDGDTNKILECGKNEFDIESAKIICGKTTSTIEYYAQTCGKEVRYNKTCGKDKNTIDYYAVSCGKTENTVERKEQQGSTILTNSEGHYEFNHLNAMKKYYIKFTYNGMLYTNVERLQGNADDISKATEAGQKHDTNRQNFNNLFAEIGSYPQNYKIKNKVFGNDLGDYNKVYLQEEVADLFKEVASKFGDVSSWKNADEETKRKVQFVMDCRISAYSTETYPLIKIFTIDHEWNNIAGDSYNPIYAGAYNQLHVNLGIKARPTFDLSLYKDIFNAVLNINGKQETYTYDARKDWKNEGFNFGVREEDYLNQLREKYINGTNTNLITKETVDEGEYNHEYRTEEIINGNNQNTAINESNLYNENKNYAWRDINHELVDSDKLQIHVTYKIAIRNQSSVVGSVTEIVDYYDSHYQFEKAYMGDENGNEIAGTKVEIGETSMYGENTRIAQANGTWTVNSKKQSYKTIYLRPTEKKLDTENKEQYIYVTFGLIHPEQTLIEAGLPNGERLYTYNLAEINGYKTYGIHINDTNSLGLIDRDSNPGNFNPSTYEMGVTPLEDDESKAPAYVYSHRNSRTLEGNVFEDVITSKNSNKINTNQTRFGNGTIDKNDKKIQGVKVELVEVKNGQLVSRQTTYTDENGWYGFGAFLPGNYTIRFTYGAEDKTALTTTSQYTQGFNDTSYNGQDYQSTIFSTKQGETVTPHNYKVDDTLNGIYTANNQAKNGEENNVNVADQVITKYETDGYYWFADASIANQSDATDDIARRNQVIAYSKSEYGKEITNHKAEVFNSYMNQKTLREAEAKGKNFDKFTQAAPMEEVVDTQVKNRELVNELERRTYMYAYTPEIPVEVEYTKKQIVGNQVSDTYTYKITGVDFGVVERPRTQLTIDQDIAHVKVLASDGTTLLELNNNNGKIQVLVDNGKNYMWTNIGKLKEYDGEELLNVILDDELLNGAKLEVTYNITVTNNSEQDANSTTRAKTIMNYVANNLNFDLSDNNGLWEVVKKEDIQTASRATWINNETGKNNKKLVDLTTQTTVLKATEANPLTKALKPGESTTSTLTLKKTISAESSADDLSYSNMSEIVEIDNTVGRYDHGAIPGNQSLEKQPREHDASGASRYDEMEPRYPQDGKIIITPPTGSTPIYYILGITAALILAGGIFIIKKFVMGRK